MWTAPLDANIVQYFFNNFWKAEPAALKLKFPKIDHVHQSFFDDSWPAKSNTFSCAFFDAKCDPTR